MKTITSVEAQNNFWALMDQAMRGPVTITKHGKPRVVMVAYSDDLVEFSEVSREEVPDNVFEAYKKSLKSDPKTYTNI
jgi:prevent-host-death family protein